MSLKREKQTFATDREATLKCKTQHIANIFQPNMKLQFYLIYFSLSTLTLDLWHVLLLLPSVCTACKRRRIFISFFATKYNYNIRRGEISERTFFLHDISIQLSYFYLCISIQSPFHLILHICCSSLTPSTIEKKGYVCIYLLLLYS